MLVSHRGRKSAKDKAKEEKEEKDRLKNKSKSKSALSKSYKKPYELHLEPAERRAVLPLASPISCREEGHRVLNFQVTDTCTRSSNLHNVYARVTYKTPPSRRATFARMIPGLPSYASTIST